MPDDLGKLSLQETKVAVDWLAKHGDKAVCGICGTASWRVETSLAILPISAKGGVTIPAIAIYCINCGHIELFSAAIIGLVPSYSTMKDGENQGGR